jgi:hypothetical protein
VFDELAKQMSALSRGASGALGVLEMLGAVLLVVPAAARSMPVLTPIAAAALALETLALAGVYARCSLEVAVTNPLVWAVVMGLWLPLWPAGGSRSGPWGNAAPSRGGAAHAGAAEIETIYNNANKKFK